jgi:hypothetical protein
MEDPWGNTLVSVRNVQTLAFRRIIGSILDTAILISVVGVPASIAVMISSIPFHYSTTFLYATLSCLACFFTAMTLDFVRSKLQPTTGDD